MNKFLHPNSMIIKNAFRKNKFMRKKEKLKEFNYELNFDYSNYERNIIA